MRSPCLPRASVVNPPAFPYDWKGLASFRRRGQPASVSRRPFRAATVEQPIPSHTVQPDSLKAVQVVPPAAVAREPRAASRRIRTNVAVLIALLALILVQVSFLFSYSGFTSWQTIDSNLLIFVAVNVNIVLLTAVFYLILRHIFKLAYERHTLAGMSLRTKLIVTFLALSLPSTGFHLIASGFIAQIFKSWSVGEYQQVLDNARVVTDSLSERQHEFLRVAADRIGAVLPRGSRAYARTDWQAAIPPNLVQAVYVYDQQGHRIGHWVRDPEFAAYTAPPPPEYFSAGEGFFWIERFEDRQVRRLLFPLPSSPQHLKAEVIQIEPAELAQAVMKLEIKEHSSAVLGRDLLLLVLAILVGITILIIFAATWIAFYLARGFVSPIERLANATRRVSAGELGHVVEGGTLGPLRQDFEGLVNAFNAMSRQLKQQHVQLTETAEDLRESHRELAEGKRFVELLLENIEIGIISLDGSGAVTSLNRSAIRMCKPRVEPYLERHYRAVFDREIADVLDGLVERVAASPHRPVEQNLTLSANLRQVHVEVSTLAPESGNAERAGVVVMIEDVSNLQRTQRALAWREVARRVAHEIKNPLTPIQLSAQRIRRHYLENLRDDARVLDQCTQTIINQVSSLKMMVNEFSEFAKLPESRPVPGDLNSVVRELARFYEGGLPEAIHLVLELDANAPRLPIDPEQMKRAFTNLIDNAAASIRGQGTVTLRTRFNPETRSVVAEVIDDGIGVPEEVRARLFEPYTSTKEGGTGLGLTIVNQIVSDHGGFVRYSGREPNGSIFSMELPVR
jgi:two-component system nitrogen regulation sensor histidine kinase NtrY